VARIDVAAAQFKDTPSYRTLEPETLISIAFTRSQG